jgi:hypothetical protein
MASSNGAHPAIRGRPFATGNPGRRPGSKNRTSVISAALSQDEIHKLIRKAYELAMGGDVPSLKFLLARSLPRDRLIEIDLPPINSADDAVEALARITRAVSEAEITPSEGASLVVLINSSTHAIDIADLVKRIDAIDARFMAELAPPS